MAENLAIFDFNLSEDDMTKLSQLDVKQAIDGWPASMQEDNYQFLTKKAAENPQSFLLNSYH